tara:strand:- start:2 stop:301 length:300 start_codon:yes stop_codon:yes gene_type:complete
MPTDLENYTSVSAICSTYVKYDGGEKRCLDEPKGCAWMRLVTVTNWNPHGAGQCVAAKWCQSFTMNNKYYECIKGTSAAARTTVNHNTNIGTNHAGMRK